ncbi:MAG: PepSY domain-containing protein [Alphaproteobacteria bacterium]|nr:PepSY domain-containing protein [Alphaproteobacteria bacterium]MBV9542613.1 PepSY domain-containing protein [Alphaproteobacteria bacterium]MBV9904250.1 PepSY domain-containing protein [Alphaproteobacteria bacterium]
MKIQKVLGALTLGLLVSSAMVTAVDAAPPRKAKLHVPKPKLAKGQAYSPHTVVAMLAKKKYRVLELYRKGQAYAVVATDQNGNKVQMTIDGASGSIVGLAVIQPAPHTGKPAKGQRPPPPPHTYGAIVPKVAFSHWTAYHAADWNKPSGATIPVQWTYAPYREALPYTYYVPLHSGQDYVPVIPPGYVGYDVYDPYGHELANAWDAADNAEYNAALAAERADYEAARADAAEADNAALRDDLDAINSEPPDNYDPDTTTDDDLAPPDDGDDNGAADNGDNDDNGAGDNGDHDDNGAGDNDDHDDSGAGDNGDDNHDGDDNGDSGDSGGDDDHD